MSVIFRETYKHHPQNADKSGWSFLQLLSETKGIVQNREDETKKTPYIHQTEKRSVAKLSLEMCTESLGTENGSESGDEISLLAIEATTNIQTIPPLTLTMKPQEETHFKVCENTFPPPLNSIKGFNFSRMVKTYGEDGRLVVQAIRVCSPPSCFVSERCEGRLRLCLSDDSLLSQAVDGANDSEVEARDKDEDEDKREEEDDDAEEEEEEEYEEGLFENNKKFKGKIGNKKFTRPRRRCNENGSELKWKQQQFWLTS